MREGEKTLDRARAHKKLLAGYKKQIQVKFPLSRLMLQNI